MAGSLACILSYGLTCTPARVEPVELPDVAIAQAPAGDDPTEAKASAPPAAKGSASTLLARVQTFYSGTKDLKTRFTQTYMHPVYGTKKVSKGTLKALKPGMMVWDYEDENNADYWVEGKRLFVVEQATKQVLREDLGSSDIAGAEQFLFGSKSLTEDYLVKLADDALGERYGMKGHTAIRLKPKRANLHYQELMLIVDDETGRVDAFVVLNQDRSTNHFELTGLARNLGYKVDDFKFKTPAGYKEVSVD